MPTLAPLSPIYGTMTDSAKRSRFPTTKTLPTQTYGWRATVCNNDDDDAKIVRSVICM